MSMKPKLSTLEFERNIYKWIRMYSYLDRSGMNHHYGNKILFLFACIYKYLSFLHIFAIIIIHVMYIYLGLMITF